jgi:hypothetical protein
MRRLILTLVVIVVTFLIATIFIVTQPTTILPATPNVFSEAPWWLFTCPIGWLPKYNFQTTYLTCVDQSYLHLSTSTRSGSEASFHTNLTSTGLLVQPPLPATLYIAPPLVLNNSVTNCGPFDVSNFTINSFSLNYTLPASVNISYHIDYMTTHYLFPNDTLYIQQLSQCSLVIDSVAKA